jgi:predicted ATPase
MDHLAAADKQLLQIAAVVGPEAPVELLRLIAGVPEGALQESLGRLQAAEFLFERSLARERTYAFKHALTHAVAYASVPTGRRQALHGRIVAAIEALHPGRPEEHLELLAHHAFQAAIWDRAATLLRRAGELSAGRSAHREAAARFEQALAALGHLPASRERTADEVDLRIAIRDALYPLGRLDRIVEHLREAEALARTLDDPVRTGGSPRRWPTTSG